MVPKTLAFLPPKKMMENYKRDYNQVKEHMIYGKNISEFEVLISRLNLLLSNKRTKKIIQIYGSADIYFFSSTTQKIYKLD